MDFGCDDSMLDSNNQRKPGLVRIFTRFKTVYEAIPLPRSPLAASLVESHKIDISSGPEDSPPVVQFHQLIDCPSYEMYVWKEK